METYIAIIKDFLVVVAPIVVAYISYLSSKKTARDIRLELEKRGSPPLREAPCAGTSRGVYWQTSGGEQT